MAPSLDSKVVKEAGAEEDAQPRLKVTSLNSKGSSDPMDKRNKYSSSNYKQSTCKCVPPYSNIQLCIKHTRYLQGSFFEGNFLEI